MISTVNREKKNVQSELTIVTYHKQCLILLLFHKSEWESYSVASFPNFCLAPNVLLIPSKVFNDNEFYVVYPMFPKKTQNERCSHGVRSVFNTKKRVDIQILIINSSSVSFRNCFVSVNPCPLCFLHKQIE